MPAQQLREPSLDSPSSARLSVAEHFDGGDARTRRVVDS
jgi:hypothetical protein